MLADFEFRRRFVMICLFLPLPHIYTLKQRKSEVSSEINKNGVEVLNKNNINK